MFTKKRGTGPASLCLSLYFFRIKNRRISPPTSGRRMIPMIMISNTTIASASFPRRYFAVVMFTVRDASSQVTANPRALPKSRSLK